MHAIIKSCFLFLWMHSLTFVKSQERHCTLQDFIDGEHYDKHFDTTDMQASYGPGTQVRVACKVGFSGFFKLLCISGKWQKKGMPCEPRSCGHPGDTQFADFHLENGDDFVFGSKVIYTCHKGYHMATRMNHRNCMAEGWDGVVPICEAQKCPVIFVDDNVQVNGDPEQATYGNVVRFSCKSNVQMLYGAAEIYCDENGLWNEPAPKCKAIKCKKPVIEHARVIGGLEEYNEHEVLQFVCNERYRAPEHRPSKCLKIGERAEWSPTPLCEEIKCRLDLTPLPGTRYVPAFRNVFTPGDKVTVMCGEKYYILTRRENSKEIRCQSDGEWSTRPVCQEVTCSTQRPKHVYNWAIYWGMRITQGDTVTYSCHQGHRITDSRSLATCTRDGWSPNPLCKEITCNRLNIENGYIRGTKEIYKYSQQVRVLCNEGYKGGATLTCQESGWTPRYRQPCIKITCDKVLDDNADITSVVKPKYDYNERVVYTCKNGYEGEYTQTCTATGWIKTSECQEILCQRPVIKNANIFNSNKLLLSYRHSQYIHYTCNGDDSHVYHIATCQQGDWTLNQHCQDITCDKVLDDNADITSVIKPKYDYNERVVYTCKNGYEGEYTQTCTATGWIKTSECQEQKQCSVIPVIPNGKATPQKNVHGRVESITIDCNKGYKATVDSLSCQEDQWSPVVSVQEICTIIPGNCNLPPRVEHALVLSAPEPIYLSGSEVSYQCRDGYTMEGQNKLKCVNSTWQEVNMMCTLYCDRPEDEGKTMIFATNEDIRTYKNGTIINYECATLGVDTKGTATCINGKWEKTVTCKDPTDPTDPAQDGDVYVLAPKEIQ